MSISLADYWQITAKLDKVLRAEMKTEDSRFSRKGEYGNIQVYYHPNEQNGPDYVYELFGYCIIPMQNFPGSLESSPRTKSYHQEIDNAHFTQEAQKCFRDQFRTIAYCDIPTKHPTLNFIYKLY